MIYSGWFPASKWVRALDSVADYTFDKSAPTISTSIINNGVIMAYMKLVADSGAIRQLPATIITSNFFAHHGYLIPPGGGKLRFTFNNYGGTNLPDTATQYRYLIIPGGLVGGRILLHGSLYTSQQLGGMDYSEIKQIFHLPENGSNQ
ncbi:MAG: hypothetical protein NVS1B13_07500 [Flavisolibacter sp.]